jgi:hypothetical protein
MTWHLGAHRCKVRVGKFPGCGALEAVSSIYSNCNATPAPLLLASKGRR